MDPELKYTRISISQLKGVHPQLLPVITEEPYHNARKRESLALHPICECNCCCYFCCGCPELYTPVEMQQNQNRMTLCPLTSKVVNPALVADVTPDDYIHESSKASQQTNPVVCLLTPFTLIIDLLSAGPRCAINLCR